jgi:hypothetical protein
VLAITIARAKEYDQIKGIVPHFIEDGLSLLQCVDDTNIFMGHDIESVTFSPGLRHEPGSVTFSPGLRHKPGLKVPLVPVCVSNPD